MQSKPDTRTQILDVAEALCAEVGPQAVRLDQIARRVGVKPPSIYAHFKNLDAVMAAVSKRGLEACLAIYDSLPSELPPVDALNLSASRLIDLMIIRPGIARMILSDLSLPGGDEAVSTHIWLAKKANAREQALFHAAVAQGLLPPSDPSLWIARRLGSVFVTLSLEWLSDAPLTDKRVAEVKAFLAIPAP